MVITRNVSQFIRYGLISAIALSVDLLILIFATEVLGMFYLISAAISFLIGLVVSYQLSIKHVFMYRKYAGKKIEFTLYVITGIVGLVIMEALLFFITEYWDMHYLISKLQATIVVFISVYLLRKFILFN